MIFIEIFVYLEYKLILVTVGSSSVLQERLKSYSRVYYLEELFQKVYEKLTRFWAPFKW